MKRPRRVRRRAGFSLLELLVALLIVAVAATALLAWTAALRQMSYLESLSASAIALCQFKLEEIRALHYRNVKQESFPNETGLLLDGRGTKNPHDDIRVTRVVVIRELTDMQVPLKEVIVRCVYRVGGQEYTEELTTWISIAG